MPSISGKLVHTSIPTKQKVCSKESSAKAQEEGHCQKLKRPSSDSQKKSLSTSGKTKPRESMPLSTKQDRIKSCFERASTKLYCLFLQASILAFDKVNLLLQSDKPNIHVLGRELQAVYTDLLCKFVKPAVLVAASSVYTVDFRSLNNQKSENDLVIGTKTRQYLYACFADKSQQHEDVKLSYSSVKAYFSEACTYLQKKFPLQDELLRNAQVADISQREKVSFDCVRYFVDRFGLVKEEEMDELESQFVRYQIFSFSEDILSADRADVAWNMIGQLKNCTTQKSSFSVLVKVKLMILTIPHSNADSERVFSIVRKNHTEFRPNLSDRTLEALLVQKLHILARDSVCYKMVFGCDLLKKCKQATNKKISGI
ncbi:UNVERIFIED_CONTAM: hypothetical protein FKN15_006871 [Acipenser sinensis]